MQQHAGLLDSSSSQLYLFKGTYEVGVFQAGSKILVITVGAKEK